MELSKDLEVRVLSIIRKKKYWNRYKPVLKPSFFSEDTTKHIYSLYQKYFSRYPGVKRVSIADLKIMIRRFTKDDNRRKDCHDLARVLKKTVIPARKFIEETITEFAQRQMVKTIIMEGIELLELDEFNTDKLKGYFTQIDQIKGATNADHYNYLKTDRFTIEKESKAKRIPTGIEEIDQCLRGGLEAGELCIILAPPERGKTMAMVNMGAHAMQQGLLVYHSTHEIGADHVAQRYDKRLTMMDADQLMKNPEDLHKALRKLTKVGGELVIKDFAAKDAKLDDLNSSIVSFISERKRKPDLIIVDYADLMSSGKGLSDRFEIAAIYKGLRRMAQSLKIPIITGSQGNRKSMDKLTVTMKDFAEDISKAATGDVIITLCQTPEEEEDKMMRLHIAKSRRRPGHPTFRVMCDGETQFIGSFKRDKNS